MSYERYSDADDGAGAPASPVLDGTQGGTADGAESGVGDSPRASSSTDRTAPHPTGDDATLSRGDVLATGDVSLLSGATDSLVGRSVAISSFEVEAGAAEAVPLARLRSLFLEARSGGLLAYTLALAIIAGYAMVDTRQNIFRDNAYHIGSAACRCVMVNTYLALMQGAVPSLLRWLRKHRLILRAIDRGHQHFWRTA